MNSSTTHTKGWASEPPGRGTFGLLSSCFATVILCTWNAVHLDVPAQTLGKWRLFWRRIFQCLLCLSAPEYTVSVALNELREARYIKSLVRRTPFPQMSPSERPAGSQLALE